VIAVEDGYRAKFGPQWSVKARFTDPQGKGDRITWQNMGLKSSWPVKTRNKTLMITNVQNIVIDDCFAVDVEQAPVFCEEIEIWQRKDDGKELDKWNHAMSAWRYGISNAEIVEGHARSHVGGISGMKNGSQQNASVKQVSTAASIMQLDHNQVHYGSVAAIGGSQVRLDPNFVLSDSLR
jgi:hypothetical protein